VVDRRLEMIIDPQDGIGDGGGKPDSCGVEFACGMHDEGVLPVLYRLWLVMVGSGGKGFS
jgi:hypothetical protein